MVDAAVIQYRQEYIAGFEKRQSLARRCTTTEAVIKGNQATFVVIDSGGATAVTRGINGDIPSRGDNSNQYTATLVEWHDLVEKTRFNIFASQGDQRRAMQETSISVVNRKIDTDIHTALATATLAWNSGSATAATKPLINAARTTLANNFALESGDSMFALITPAYYSYLSDLPSFSSADYVQDSRFEGVEKSMAFNWWGINWIVDAGLPGAGTSDATCFMFSRKAIGHAMDMENLDTNIGYDGKQDKSWARATGFFSSKVLQNSGIIKMPHNDSAYSIS